MKTHKQLTVPETSAWDKKSHSPLLLFRRAIYNKWPHSFLDRNMDKYIFDPYYNIKNGLISLWTWKSVIWKDRHWDDHYILEVLKHKLILQRKELVSANRHTSIPQTNRDITICLNLIERIQEEYYNMEYMDYFVSDYTWEDYDETGSKQLVIDEISNTADDYFKIHRSTVKKCLKKDRNLLFDKKRLAMAVSLENQKKCQALLFRILSERINWWWD